MRKYILLVFGIIFCFSFSLSEVINVNIDIGVYMVKNGRVILDEYGNLTSIGKPSLSSKIINVILPPYADQITGIDVTYLNKELRKLNSDIEPVKPFIPMDKNEKIIENIHKLYEKNKKIYEKDEFYPKKWYKYLGIGKWGDIRYAKILVIPISYNPVKRELLVRNEININISYTTKDTKEKVYFCPFVEKSVLNKFFANWNVMNKFFTNKKTYYDYLIFASGEIVNNNIIDGFVQWKESLGYSINVINYDEISSKFDKNKDEADEFRDYLIQYYNNNGMMYVLLIGDTDVIPMKYMCAAPDGNDDWGYFTSMPTDLYYSDLTSDWDTDGDGYYGEYSTGENDQDYGVDFTPEIFVGRIPWNDASSITQALNNAVVYEQNSDAEWKNNILLPGAILNYENEDGHSGWEKTDNAVAFEYYSDTCLDNYTTISLYEREGINPSIYQGDAALNHNNFVSYCNNNSYSFINWGAHGGPYSASRKYWDYDDGDGVPTAYEMAWADFVSLYDLPSKDINLQNPTVFFCASCLVGYPDGSEQSLGEVLNKSFGAAVLSSSRVAWYKIGWEDPSCGGLATLNFLWLDYMTNSNKKVGSALGLAKFDFSQNYFFGDPDDSDGIVYPELGNLYDFNIYGDPSLTFGKNSLVDIADNDNNYIHLHLQQNYPNPFNPITKIAFNLPKNVSNAVLQIFDINGELVKELNCSNDNFVIWNGVNNLGKRVASGVYLYRIKSSLGITDVKKMLLLK